MKNMNAIFQIALADYSIEQIHAAFAFHLKYGKGLPEPSDIATVIERGNKPPFERSVYINFTKKSPENRTSDEWKYIREYEKFMVTGKN